MAPDLLDLGRELYLVGEWDELGRLLDAAAPDLRTTRRGLLTDLAP